MNDTSVLVMGVGGMLGHKMFQALRRRYPLTRGSMRDDPRRGPYAKVDLLQGSDVWAGVDASETVPLKDLLVRLQPSYIVNCVGIIKQRAEASAAVPSIAINALLPHLLADWARGWGGRVIHFSTDCVFSGRQGHYREDDRSDVDDLYGRTKSLGEVTGDNALTLRTSIIGRELNSYRSLLEWALSRRNTAIEGYTRAIYSGVTTNYLSRVVCDLIAGHSTLSGLYQVASDPISKFELLSRIDRLYRLNLTIKASAAEVSDRSLVGDKFRAATGIVTPPWDELLRELRDDPTPYEEWRSH